MDFFNTIIHVRLLRAGFLAHDLNHTVIKDQVPEFLPESFYDGRCTTGCLINIPVEYDFGIRFINMLSTRTGTSGKSKSEF